MKYYPADAFIIKTMDYGESHKIFTLFGREQGRFSALARGVKKPKSLLRGHLQLGNRCDFLIYRGKTLDTISQAQVKETYPEIWRDHTAYIYASYFFELLNLSLPEREENREVFALTHSVLGALGSGASQSLARYFELGLLAALGYDNDFNYCCGCGKKISSGFLSPRFPGVICSDCGSGYVVSPQSLYALGYYRRCSIDMIDRLKVSDEMARELARTTKHMLVYNLDKKIKSLDIIGEIK